MIDAGPTVQGVSYLMTLCGVCTVWHVLFAVFVITRYRAYIEGGWKQAVFGRQANRA